jgi:hypothetical protein
VPRSWFLNTISPQKLIQYLGQEALLQIIKTDGKPGTSLGARKHGNTQRLTGICQNDPEDILKAPWLNGGGAI